MSEMKIAEISRLICEFKDKIDIGTSDTENFMTFHEMERLWSELRLNSDKIYSDMVCEMLDNVDEKDIVRKKKENTKKVESD
jgi:hypothetical protein